MVYQTGYIVCGICIIRFSKNVTALTVEVFMTSDNSENFEDTWGSMPVDLANNSLP
jgi:hypothetical protein